MYNTTEIAWTFLSDDKRITESVFWTWYFEHEFDKKKTDSHTLKLHEHFYKF